MKVQISGVEIEVTSEPIAIQQFRAHAKTIVNGENFEAWRSANTRQKAEEDVILAISEMIGGLAPVPTFPPEPDYCI